MATQPERTVPAASFWLKFERAIEHMHEACSVQHEWAHACINQRTGEGKIVQPPSTLSLAAGDAVQCFRQALDHAAFSLALDHDPDLPELQAKRLYFPHKLKSIDSLPVSEASKSTIRSYLSRTFCGETGEETVRSLNEIARIDRHRLIPALTLAKVAYRPTGESLDLRSGERTASDSGRAWHTASANWATAGNSRDFEDVRRRLHLFRASVDGVLQQIDQLLGDPVDLPDTSNRSKQARRAYLARFRRYSL